ncbi:A-kinase anchor protein 6 [Microcaecilia unicolor]|uniref:A-kinase anchor protein 6 n=1 Tax=Microcaecilia unicolor TaxID=1415580 RepID=A0A6P7Z3V6_9AMPH|nr:A-kinase anchor protein 6 [Microcaecilia unicolor]
MNVALSPMRPQELVPMAAEAMPMADILMPKVDPGGNTELMKAADSAQRYEKPPPLHTGADWKIVLHLPEIETWLRATSERVRDLTYSVQQDSTSKHVDVHLVQLKDICEDISDHVEQIHALLETEFSLKLLSCSVNVIVDIHTVQLLWHQLRVSVLVLRERILQGLQDTNGNYTRQTDILQAFSEETQEDRLDSLTEVDDSGQLTIKCSQNYLSLDCGITAFELSDYSPSEDLLGGLGDTTSSCTNAKPLDSLSCSAMEKDFPELDRSVGLLSVTTDPAASESRGIDSLPSSESKGESHGSTTTPVPTGLSCSSPPGMFSGGKNVHASGDTLEENEPVSELVNHDCHATQKPIDTRGKLHPHWENSIPKRPIRDCFNYNEDSPTQPTLPKRGLFLEEGKEVFPDDIQANSTSNHLSSLILKNDLSRSTPSLMDHLDRSKLCLSLESSYCSSPSVVSQSYDCLFKMEEKKLDYIIKNSHKNSTVNPSRSDGLHPKEKRRHKKSRDAPEANLDQTSGVSKTISPKQEGKRWTTAVENGISSGTSESMEETDSASMVFNQASPSSQIQSNTDSSLPPYTLKKWSSTGSGTIKASTSALSDSKNKKGSSSSSYASSNEKNNRAWYGSDEYLALPSHLRQTEVLAQKLENLAKMVPQNPLGETIQNIDDWELSEMNSDSEMYPIFPINKKHKRLGRVSPSSSSDIAPSLDDSIESGPLSDILSDDDLFVPVSSTKKHPAEKLERSLQDQLSEMSEKSSISKSALIQQLMQDIQQQENYEAIWEKIEGFVNKLDKFIHWLKEAMETSENWTPPKAETDSLKLYLETHLSFKLNVDSHCALKEAVVEEGRQLLELIISHKSGLKDMLPMIVSQWKELQRQIKRQHSWILRALDIIKAEILASDVSVEDEAGTGSPKADAQLCYLEAKRDAVEQMSLKLYSEQCMSSRKRRDQFVDMPKIHGLGSNGLLDFDSDYQELWDWLIDMESIVMDSHGLMMSEEQQQHLYKRYSVEMSIREPKKLALLKKVDYLRKNGGVFPGDLLQKVESINEKWELLGKTLGEKIQSAVGGQSEPSPRDVLSPESGKLVKELEVQIKELKGWLRETELFIFNSCLRREKGEMVAEKQLQYFKSLCCEIKQRRRGVSSILRLCQHLLENQETCNLDADHQSMQLIIVNLERRWEAIVMQAVQWQTRLQKQLGQGQEIVHIIDLDLMDLSGANEDALEWDETDISHKLICINEESNSFEHEDNLDVPIKALDLEGCVKENQNEKEDVANQARSLNFSSVMVPLCPPVYQVYSLHNVELYERNQAPFFHKTLKLPNVMIPSALQKSLSKDSSFSSTKSLPEIVNENASFQPYNALFCKKLSRNSGSKSGIVSEGGTETTTHSETCLLADMGGTHKQRVDTELLDFQMAEIVDVLKQKIEDEKIMFPGSSQSVATTDCVNGKERDFKIIPKYTSKCLKEEMQEKHDVFTFYDYSYLQGSKHNWPLFVKHVQGENLIENDHREQNTSHFCFDGVHCRSKHPELQPCESILPVSSGEPDLNSLSAMEGIKLLMNKQTESQFSCLSHGSSLDSLCTAGDLFGLNISKPRDGLQRSTSLESWLVSCKSNEDLFSQHSSGDISISSDSVGELSKRTLDLLKRLEDIESPTEQKIKHSISDIMLQSTSQKISLPGQPSLDLAFSMNEDSAASLTELSSSEELSLCSEDIVLHKNKIPNSNASFQKHLNQSVADESDVNVSMIVNVSCTSACTDDEDDSDLLSSSTLTLTEEELCIKDEDDISSIATDDDIYEESSFLSGIDYIKNELQTWNRPRFLLLKEKKKCNFSDSIHSEKDGSANKIFTVTDKLHTESVLNSSSCRYVEDNANSRNASNTSGLDAKDQSQKDSLQVDKGQLVDDMENGNVESTDERSKEGPNRSSALEDVCTVTEHITGRGFSSCELFTDIPNKTDPNTQVCSDDFQNYLGSSGHQSKSPHSSPTTNYCTVSVLKDEDKGAKSTPILSYECEDQPNGTNDLAKSSDCYSSFTETKIEDLASASCVSCCRCDSKPSDRQTTEDCSVHNFVMEIIDMASMALKNKSQSECELVSPTSLAQIKEKVLEHSHRPIQLRKGDFYSYLSLSSHDSDCGEVVIYTEDKSRTPVPKDFSEISLYGKDDLEYAFEACTDDEPVEEQSCLPSGLTEGLVACEDMVSLEESKAPISLQLDKTDIQELGSIKQNATHVTGGSETLNISHENSSINRKDDGYGNKNPKSSSVTSTKVSALDLHLKSSNMTEQNTLHHNTKTLTSEQNLQPQVCQASYTKKPRLNSGADSSSIGQGGL